MTDTKYPITVQERLAELDDARQILIAEITDKNCDPYKPDRDGRWSIAEIAYHLHLTEMSIIKMLQHTLKEGQRHERVPDDKLRMEWQGLGMALGNREMKIKAPNFVEPEKAPRLEETLQLLEQSRQALRDTVKDLSIDDLASVSVPHPVKAMGNLTGAGWLTLVGRHELRHVDQIKELKAAENH